MMRLKGVEAQQLVIRNRTVKDLGRRVAEWLERGSNVEKEYELIDSVTGYTLEMSSGVIDLQGTSILCSGRIKVQ